jgi:uncharacterized membrane protein
VIQKARALLEQWSPLALKLLIVADLLAGLVLRFATNSKLWLDEAQSVNIAAKPISQIPKYLGRDGAPPLYYVVLHVWMGVVGTSDFAVRSLSGIFAVFALLVAYRAMSLWWNREGALLATAVLAILPYAIYFGTEARMYSLVMLESAAILWALRRQLDDPKWSTTGLLAVLGGLLLYTHYWGIYLLGAIGLYAAARWVRHRAERERHDQRLVLAIVGAFVLWLPWFPTFNSQRLHTGTPWSTGTTYYQLFTWFDGFVVNQSVPHVVSSLHTEITIILFVGLVLIGVFGLPMARRGSEMVLRMTGNSATRTISFIVIVTMAAGLIASHLSNTAYVPRYAAVIAIPMAYLAARGVQNFTSSFKILLIMVLLSGAFLWTDRWGVTDQRTQAGEIAAALVHAPTNAVVYVCPDQLGPSLTRYANPNLKYLGYPRMQNPSIVNWYNYEAAYDRMTPAQQAAKQAATIAPSETVYVVRALNYGLKDTCWNFMTALGHDLGRPTNLVVKQNIGGFYQPMMLQELPPTSK